jgi:hypothetical protein
MGALLGILGAVLIGKVAISAALSAALLSGVASVPVWIDLGGGAVTLVQLDAKLLKALAAQQKARTPRQRPNAAAGGSPAQLCFSRPYGTPPHFCP